MKYFNNNSNITKYLNLNKSKNQSNMSINE